LHAGCILIASDCIARQIDLDAGGNTWAPADDDEVVRAEQGASGSKRRKVE
jgi:hypothetical protein